MECRDGGREGRREEEKGRKKGQKKSPRGIPPATEKSMKSNVAQVQHFGVIRVWVVKSCFVFAESSWA